jgi:hypothetical protein
MMADAANEKIVRRDMIAVLPRLPKKRIPRAPRQTILEQVAPESRNLPQQRCARRPCFVDLDQPGDLEAACIRTMRHPVRD